MICKLLSNFEWFSISAQTFYSFQITSPTVHFRRILSISSHCCSFARVGLLVFVYFLETTVLLFTSPLQRYLVLFVSLLGFQVRRGDQMSLRRTVSRGNSITSFYCHWKVKQYLLSSICLSHRFLFAIFLCDNFSWILP